MSAPAEGPATVTLTDQDRDFAEYGCEGTGKYRRCHDMSERFEELVAVVDDLTADLAAARARELDNHHNAAVCPYCTPALADAERVIANVRAHIEALAGEMSAAAYLTLSQALPAAPTGEGS